jgi:hypothetical protein
MATSGASLLEPRRERAIANAQREPSTHSGRLESTQAKRAACAAPQQWLGNPA